MRAIAVVLAVAAMIAGPGAAMAAETARQAYLRELVHVCKRQVTPELLRLYQEAVKELDASGDGNGRNSNFSGIRDPHMAFSDCVQSPGMPR